MNLQPNPTTRAARRTPKTPASSPPAATRRVLRNTYALLALSMIPTVAGAWLGLATGLAGVHGRHGRR